MMSVALECAQQAAIGGDVPIGAVLVDVKSKRVIARAGNEVYRTNDPTAHAEILAIRRAAQALGTAYLTGTALHVTLEPCAMCAQAISLARIPLLYISALDEKGGAVYHGARIYDQPTCHHVPEVYHGFMEEQSRRMLQKFFHSRR